MSFQALHQYVKTSGIINQARRKCGYDIDTDCKLSQLLCRTTDMSFFVEGRIPSSEEKDVLKVVAADLNSNWETTLQDKIDATTLKEFARPAPHGHGTQTLVDEKVRCALEIPAKQLVWVPDRWCQEVLPKVCRVLCPPGKTLRPQLYKMHIYEPGGFFETHVDTMHAPNHFATLVIVLPTDFEGGDLTVSHNGVDKVFAPTSDKYWRGIPWCAFFTDCRHSVSPVTEGTRVVLQYDLYLESAPNVQTKAICHDSEPNEDEKEDEEDDNKNNDEDEDFSDEAEHPKLSESMPGLKTCLWGISDDDPSEKYPTWTDEIRQNILQALQQHFDEEDSNVVRLGIILRHQYGRDTVSLDLLRGTDAVLANLLSSTYDCSVEPFLLYKTNGHDDETLDVKLFLLDKDGQKVESADNDTSIVPSSTTVFTQLLEYDPYVAYTGNESSPAEYLYFGAVLFLKRKSENCGPAVVEPPRKKQKTRNN